VAELAWFLACVSGLGFLERAHAYKAAKDANLEIGVGTFFLKLCFFLFFFVWVRWTIPRFRYDQVMRIGWRVLLPIAVLNLLVYFAWYAING
jgi:NADH:ubiquinone oxidoreductase subunit H